MKLKFNRNSELIVTGFGIYKPDEIIEISDDNSDEINKYLNSGYFTEIKETKAKKKSDVI